MTMVSRLRCLLLFVSLRLFFSSLSALPQNTPSHATVESAHRGLELVLENVRAVEGEGWAAWISHYADELRKQDLVLVQEC